MKDKLLGILNRPEVKASFSTVVAGVSAVSSQMGVVLTAFKEVASIADEAKGQRIVRGLASGLNQELFLNEIQNYIHSSDKNASFFANMLRKALLAESPIACTLMGREY